jgi:hypothetical protein
MNSYFKFLSGPYLNLSVIFIIIGCIILVIAFFSCCRVCTENACNALNLCHYDGAGSSGGDQAARDRLLDQGQRQNYKDQYQT